VVLVLAVTLPFLYKPITSDDIYTIMFSRQIIEHPLDPYGFQMDGLYGKISALKYTDPPLVIYYASLIISLFGENELLLHLSYVIFPLIAGLSMYFLSKRFSRKPLLATLLMIATPIFVVTSNSLALDLPVFSFILLGLFLFIRGVDTDNKKLLIVSSVIAGLAIMVKYNAVLLICLMVLYSLLNRKFYSLRYLLITAVIITIYFAHNYYFYGTIHLFQSVLPWLIIGKGVTSGIIPWATTTITLIVSNLNHIGGVSIFTPFLVIPFLKSRRNLLLLLILFIISIILAVALYFASSEFLSGQYTLLQLIFFTIFVSSSLFFLLLVLFEKKDVIIKSLKNIFSYRKLIKVLKFREFNDTIFLLFWIAGIFIFNSIIAGGCPRYNTLLLPPIVFFFINIIEKYISLKKIKKFLALAIASTLILSYILGYADFLYASSYKKFSDSFEFPQDNSVFFLGHEGFKYYMEKNGAIYYRSYDGELKKGDIIIRSTLPSPGELGEDLASRLDYIKTIKIDTDYPIRTINTEAHAGWYMYGAGFLPYSISKAPLERFDVYVVKG
jgi:4-amino-4-deoxy-L-arabinose transferase-like glycosyltransferase